MECWSWIVTCQLLKSRPGALPVAMLPKEQHQSTHKACVELLVSNKYCQTNKCKAIILKLLSTRHLLQLALEQIPAVTPTIMHKDNNTQAESTIKTASHKPTKEFHSVDSCPPPSVYATLHLLPPFFPLSCSNFPHN